MMIIENIILKYMNNNLKNSVAGAFLFRVPNLYECIEIKQHIELNFALRDKQLNSENLRRQSIKA